MTQNIQTILNTGQLFEDKEEYEKAYILYTESAKKFPEDLDLILRVAHIAELVGKNDVAIEYWEKSLQLNPADSGAYSKLTDLYFSVNKFKYYMTRAKLKIAENKPTQAVTDLRKSLENAENDKDVLEADFLLAQMYEATNKPQLAIEEYSKMLQLEENVNVYFKLAELCEKEDIEGAVEILNRGIKAFPDSKNLKEKLAIILTELNNPEEALKHAQTSEAKAKAYLAAGENDKAFECINNIATKNVEYYSLLAEYYFNEKDFDNCLNTIEQLEKFNALNPMPYQMKALVYEEKDDKFNSSYNWGKCYALSGKTEMALNEYLSAHNLNDKDISTLNEIVNLYENLNEKYTTFEFVEKIIVLDPENTTMLKKAAKFCLDEDNKPQAIDYLEKVVSIAPSDFTTIKKLAEIYEKSRNNLNALKYYKVYLEKAPVNEETEKIKKKIETLENTDLSEDNSDGVGLIDKIVGFFTKSK